MVDSRLIAHNYLVTTVAVRKILTQLPVIDDLNKKDWTCQTYTWTISYTKTSIIPSVQYEINYKGKKTIVNILIAPDSSKLYKIIVKAQALTTLFKDLYGWSLNVEHFIVIAKIGTITGDEAFSFNELKFVPVSLDSQEARKFAEDFKKRQHFVASV